MQLEKARAFEGVRYERYLGGVIGSEGVEVKDGEEKVLVGVCCVDFCRYALVMLGREAVCEVLGSETVSGVNRSSGCFLTVR